MATFIIRGATSAGPGGRELAFAAIAFVAGAAVFGLTKFDETATRLGTAAALVVCAAGLWSALRFMGRSGKYRAGCLPRLSYVAAIGILIASTKLSLIEGFLFIPVVLFVGAVGNLLASSAAKQTMKVESEAAQLLDRQLAAGRPTDPFFVFLRPFYITGKIKLPNPRKSSFVLLPGYYVPNSVDWESEFAQEVERFGRYVALGSPREAVGAARITTPDREWRQTFVRLATFADAIFVIPSLRPGSQFELGWLRQSGLLSKCVFLWPSGFGAIAEKHGDTWEAIARSLGVLDADASRVGGGALATFHADGTIDRFTMSLPVGSGRKLRALLEHLIPGVRTHPMNEFEATFRRCQTALNEAEPEPEPIIQADEEMEEEEPLVELTALTCAACGKPLPDTFICASCDQSA